MGVWVHDGDVTARVPWDGAQGGSQASMTQGDVAGAPHGAGGIMCARLSMGRQIHVEITKALVYTGVNVHTCIALQVSRGGLAAGSAPATRILVSDTIVQHKDPAVLGEMPHPRTGRGRHKRSLAYPAVLEMRKRSKPAGPMGGAPRGQSGKDFSKGTNTAELCPVNRFP